MKTDRFLLTIVAGIALLVVVAFVLALTKPAPTYLPDDTPEGVTHNYLFALQNDNYERAYAYLSPSLPHYPASLEEFTDEFERHTNYNLDNSTFRVNDADLRGNRAEVPVSQTTFSNDGLFDSGEYTSSAEVELKREAGEWRIVHSTVLWVWCWSDSSAVRCP